MHMKKPSRPVRAASSTITIGDCCGGGGGGGGGDGDGGKGGYWWWPLCTQQISQPRILKDESETHFSVPSIGMTPSGPSSPEYWIPFTTTSSGTSGKPLTWHVCELKYSCRKLGLRTQVPSGDREHWPSTVTSTREGAFGGDKRTNTLGPQSEQSVPRAHCGGSSEPIPPSSHSPLAVLLAQLSSQRAGASGGVGGAGSGGISCLSFLRGPQSSQSLPKAQPEYSAPGPPSSHHPSLAHEGLPSQPLEQRTAGLAGDAGGAVGGVIAGAPSSSACANVSRWSSPAGTSIVARREGWGEGRGAGGTRWGRKVWRD
eukprot:scaffold329617_cov57-Tisochrysis_lutea.AAC.2